MTGTDDDAHRAVIAERRREWSRWDGWEND
jgi:hypothetical protein